MEYMEYMVNDQGQLFAVMAAKGGIIGYAGPLAWEEAREKAPNDWPELLPGPPPGDNLRPWKFRKTGKYWHDKYGYVRAADLEQLENEGLYMEITGMIICTPFKGPPRIEIVARSRTYRNV